MKPNFSRQLISSIFLCANLLSVNFAKAAEGSILPPPTRVSPHLYAWIGPHAGPTPQNQGFRMNMGFVVGKNAVAVIETGYHEPMAREMLAQISKITKAPVKYVINTNSQPDRFLGNEHFRRQGATVIASAAEAKRMAAMGGQFAQSSELALGLQPGGIVISSAPDRILEGDAELDLGDLKIQLRQFGVAHTPGPLVVYIPKDKVVYGGDILYSGRLPAIVDGGNVRSWIEVFDKLRGFGDVTFVPGHGKPAKLSAFEFPTRAYLYLLAKHMRRAMVQGMGQQDAIQTLDQSAFAKLENYRELAGRNASFAYLEAEVEAFK